MFNRSGLNKLSPGWASALVHELVQSLEVGQVASWFHSRL